ncbi:hypothetical protein QE152_g3899 [Popillia japonica]|uniref:PiggyBac transposable element-derived protein domain-containing protein n=1 Tax=Popillia japonica TaxID=7064 RepID=A0AAW1N2X2_POPJA
MVKAQTQEILFRIKIIEIWTTRTRLLRLFEEVEAEENYESDGDDEQSEIDEIEQRSEQDFEDDVDDDIPVATTREIAEIIDVEQEFKDDAADYVAAIRDPVFIGRDKLTKWKKHCPPTNVRTRPVNIVSQLPGVKAYAKSIKSPIDIRLCLFDEEMLNIIVDCTKIKINSISQNFSREREKEREIKALIGLLYLARVRKANHMNLGDLWRTDGTGVEAFRLGMNTIKL